MANAIAGKRDNREGSPVRRRGRAQAELFSMACYCERVAALYERLG